MPIYGKTIQTTSSLSGCANWADILQEAYGAFGYIK